jgi:hypothetical protein
LGALDFFFETKPNDRGAAALRKVRAALEPGSHAGLALALESTARLAEQHRRPLSQLPGVDPGLFTEARTLAQGLREQSAAALTRPDIRSSLRSTRLRLSCLLHERVVSARAVIRFTFRAHPELVLLATSEYKRTSRQAQRAARRTPATQTSGNAAS